MQAAPHAGYQDAVSTLSCHGAAPRIDDLISGRSIGQAADCGGFAVLPSLTAGRLKPAYWVLMVWVVLSAIYWGNLFRFHPSLIDRSYDDTSEGLVIGRMARAAADGLFRNTDLGSNVDPDHPVSPGEQYYNEQKRYFEHPDLIHSLHLGWGIYPSHFALQGFLFAAIDRIDPLPREYRIGFYHLLASLFAAGAMVWIANILRRRFGWPAFFGFLIPPALEPMFSALAPNIYWVVGLWFVPMALAMLLADEDDPKRRVRLIALVFVFLLAKFLCGYEFTPSIILAAATGCLLGVKESSDRLRHILRDGAWIVGAGVAAFVVATLAHAAKKGGFAIILVKAANRITGDATSLQDELILGKFAAISSVLWTYLGGNYITLIHNFGILLTILAVYAVVTLLDQKFSWFLGPDMRKLQILAVAFLASFAAPLSWFVLGKAHTFVHPPIDLIMWYVPTIPLGFAMMGVALGQFVDHRALWKVDAARSWITAALPAVIIGAVAAIQIVDRQIQTQGTWVISAQGNGFSIFESDEIGLKFHMTHQWFIVQYRCRSVGDGETFFIQAQEDGTLVDYSFPLNNNQILSTKGVCIAAQAKSGKPITRIRFGDISKRGLIWERATTISLPETFKPLEVSDAIWDRGIDRASGTKLLMPADGLSRLFIRVGDHIELTPSDRRTVTEISPVGDVRVIFLDGGPIWFAEGSIPPLKIIRQ